MGYFKELDIEKIAQLDRQLHMEERDLTNPPLAFTRRFDKYAVADSLIDFVTAHRNGPRSRTRKGSVGGVKR